MKPKVFLAGPMRGIPREESLGWRNKAVELLERNFVVFHALRNREEKETLPDFRLAITRDKRDIEEADIVLVNDSNPNCSMIGTAMEVLYAYDRGKTIIVFGNAHDKDYWLNYHIYFRASTLEEACGVLNEFFSRLK